MTSELTDSATHSSTAWARARLALQLLARDPGGLRGMVVRARSGPVRECFVAAVMQLPAPRKLHPAMSRDALLGGVDLAETLHQGRLVMSEGLLHRGGTWILSMAERCPQDQAAILAAALDAEPEACLILLDEGADAEERAPQVLTERLAFSVDLDGIGRLDARPFAVSSELLPARQPEDDAVETLTRLAAQFGISSMRAPLLALAAARANAALSGQSRLTEDDMRVAAELVYASRATQMPEPAGEECPQGQEEPAPPPDQTSKPANVPDEILVDAVRALLPPGLLDGTFQSRPSAAKGNGAGQKKRGNRRGRPLPPRQGRLDGTARLDLVATLRAAAPWQTLRRRGTGPIKVLPSDIHVKRFESKSDRLVIFTVDASGSAALARLAEAKGAVELLLAQSYAARDHVALVTFRGQEADILLPPTRSLVQTKRRLTALPGGGGTPLAHGLKTAGELAMHARSQGLSPMLALLTDGRANIALDGTGSRAQATQDATRMGTWLHKEGVPSIVLDVGKRPQPQLATLTNTMGGQYLPLPRADAQRMSQTLSAMISEA